MQIPERVGFSRPDLLDGEDTETCSDVDEHDRGTSVVIQSRSDRPV